jgi:hypothetical protein
MRNCNGKKIRRCHVSDLYDDLFARDEDVGEDTVGPMFEDETDNEGDGEDEEPDYEEDLWK